MVDAIAPLKIGRCKEVVHQLLRINTVASGTMTSDPDARDRTHPAGLAPSATSLIAFVRRFALAFHAGNLVGQCRDHNHPFLSTTSRGP